MMFRRDLRRKCDYAVCWKSGGLYLFIYYRGVEVCRFNPVGKMSVNKDFKVEVPLGGLIHVYKKD